MELLAQPLLRNSQRWAEYPPSASEPKRLCLQQAHEQGIAGLAEDLIQSKMQELQIFCFKDIHFYLLASYLKVKIYFTVKKLCSITKKF